MMFSSSFFSQGIQMTKELFRLPLLWTSPERRHLVQRRMCKFKKKKKKIFITINSLIN
jgi:hypothetical protein